MDVSLQKITDLCLLFTQRHRIPFTPCQTGFITKEDEVAHRMWGEAQVGAEILGLFNDALSTA
jgi:hypothetical protein